MNLKQLKSKYNLSDLEFFKQKISEYKVSFVANKLKQAESVHIDGSALRLIHNKKIGFAAGYGKEDLEGLILQALNTSRFSSNVSLTFPSNLKKSEVLNDEKIGNLNKIFEEKGKAIIESILTQTGNVLVDTTFDAGDSTEILENSNDLSYLHSKKNYSFSINIRDTQENDFIEIYTASVSNTMTDETPYLNELIRFYKLSKKHAKVKDGTWPILLTSKASKELFGIVEIALNGKEVNQKSSRWYDKLGKHVVGNLITLMQDPSYGYMARLIDDEGCLTQPLTLIHNGILENFYFDLMSGSKAIPRQGSTGNGFKSSLSLQPTPTLLNMIVSCGSRSINEMIRDIDYGLLVDQTIGGLSTNISGDMSVNVEIGFLIEKGEIIGRIKDTMISGNIYSVLNNVIELSNNPRWYWSNIYSPDLLVEGFTVTSK